LYKTITIVIVRNKTIIISRINEERVFPRILITYNMDNVYTERMILLKDFAKRFKILVSRHRSEK